LGNTYWGWLYISILWLAESLRGQGVGGRLLDMAEQEALDRGCRHAHVDTLDFQALPFYEKHGYAVWGTLNDLPPGHSRYFLKKDLPTT
jgi:GNAT superfamily N-acetyltransferase